MEEIWIKQKFGNSIDPHDCESFVVFRGSYYRFAINTL